MYTHQSRVMESPLQGDSGRREFLNQIVRRGITAIPLAVPLALLNRALAAAAPDQNEWRHCNNCRSLFYNGYRNKGRCPVNGVHVYDKYSNESANNDYALIYNSPGPGQRDWRFCNKCEGLFFDGYPNKGVCAAGGAHVAAGYNFTLRFDARAHGQKNWRFCNKCELLFFDGYPGKGVCAAGGSHVAAGYNFVVSPKSYSY